MMKNFKNKELPKDKKRLRARTDAFNLMKESAGISCQLTEIAPVPLIKDPVQGHWVSQRTAGLALEVYKTDKGYLSCILLDGDILQQRLILPDEHESVFVRYTQNGRKVSTADLLHTDEPVSGLYMAGWGEFVRDTAPERNVMTVFLRFGKEEEKQAQVQPEEPVKVRQKPKTDLNPDAVFDALHSQKTFEELFPTMDSGSIYKRHFVKTPLHKPARLTRISPQSHKRIQALLAKLNREETPVYEVVENIVAAHIASYGELFGHTPMKQQGKRIQTGI